MQAMVPSIAVIPAVYIDSLLGSLPNNMLLGLFEFIKSANEYSTLSISGSLDPSL